MENPPDASGCVIHAGEHVELRSEYVILPDGSTLATLENCRLESGAVLDLYYGEPRLRHSHLKTKHDAFSFDAGAPADAASDAPDAPVDVDIIEVFKDVTVVSHKPLVPVVQLEQTESSVLTVALILGAAGVAGTLGVRAIQEARASSTANAQRAEERKQRQECGTRSDSVLVEFKAKAEDFGLRRIAEVADPTELWQRADVLEARIEQLLQLTRVSTARERRK